MEVKISKDAALRIIHDRVEQVRHSTNAEELANFEYFAHGAAVAMWELGIFTKDEHTENYDKIVSVAADKKRHK